MKVIPDQVARKKFNVWTSFADDKPRVSSCHTQTALGFKMGVVISFISAEDGFIGGTRFEAEYAVSIGVPVQVHRENGFSEWIFQHSFPFWQEDRSFLLSWEGFFHKIRFELGGSS